MQHHQAGLIISGTIIINGGEIAVYISENMLGTILNILRVSEEAFALEKNF